QQWWDVAIPHLVLPEDHLRSYTAALGERFANPRIRHLLAQIAADGSQKLPVRIVPALRATLSTDSGEGSAAAGRVRAVPARALPARGAAAPLTAADAARVRARVSGSLGRALAAVLGPWGLTDPAVVARAVELTQEIATP